MNHSSNKSLTPNAQKLRSNMTKEERRLWYNFLKELPQTFNRQKVIRNYIVDFYCAKSKLVIEIDGTQHYLEKGKSKDTVRDDYLRSEGNTILRYSNYEMNYHFDTVCEDILNHLK